ncbi:MAG: PhoU domain-containing protein, partial [Candidatus Methanosuratincola petrocarbonis]
KAEKGGDQNFRRSLLSDIIERDEDVDKLYFMGSRWLSNIMEDQSALKDYGLNDVKAALDYRIAFRNVERVSDHTIRIASKLLEAPEIDRSISEAMMQSLSEAGEIFIRSVNSLKNGSIQEASRVIHEARKAAVKEEELMRRLIEGTVPTKASASAIIVMDSIRRISEYGIGISELTFNMYVDKDAAKAD